MCMTISIQNFQIAHVNWNARYFQKIVGGWELVLQANLNLRSEEHTYGAEIFGAKVSLIASTGGSLNLGYSRLDVPLRIDYKSFLRQAEFKIRLHPPEIEEIEERRAGESVEFELEICGIGYDQKSERLLDQNTLRLNISQSEWIDLLYSAGAYSSIDISVKCPATTPDIVRQSIYRAFKAAHDQFNLGSYSSSVSNCRLLLDLVLKKEEVDVQKTFDSLASDRRRLNKYDREKLIFASLYHLTHLAHHVNEDQLPEFDRSEARLVLNATAAVIQRLVRS
jgi:hypothetical protein